MSREKSVPRSSALQKALLDPVAREALRRAIHGDTKASISIEGKAYRLTPQFTPNRPIQGKRGPKR